MTTVEVNETNLAALSGQLAQTLEASTTIQKQAQHSLSQAQTQSGFAILLLKLLSTDTIQIQIRQAGAVFFKNYIITYWVPDEDQKDAISENDRNLIKQHLVNLMLIAPKPIQAQLSEALTTISKADFPAKWQALLPELISKLNTDNIPVILGVLETLHSIFNRYRYEMKSNALWEEIKYVLEQFQEPLTVLFKRLSQLSEQHANNATLLPPIFAALNLTVQIFFSLNSQDIPEYFEDHLTEWMTAFQAFLKMKNPLLDPKNKDEPGSLDELQAVICECINLYATKYEEQFKEQKDWTAVFVAEVWSLLTTQTTDQGRYDTLVNMAIRFLTSVVKKEWHKHLFANPAHLQTICERVIIPQLRLRESDIELFSMDGVEYIRRDMEGSDVDTRRRTTMDFVRGLCTHFEKEVSQILIAYVSKLLEEYNKNKNQNWQAKDVSMFVILALSVKARTAAKGTTQTSAYINIGDFFNTQVLPELGDHQSLSERGIIKADCLNYIITFRSQLPKTSYPQIMPFLIRHLDSEELVIHTYAAIAIEKLLSVKDEGVSRFDKEMLRPFIEKLLIGLFKVLETEESRDNDYIMKAIMRVCSIGQDTMHPFHKVIVAKIVAKLDEVSKNPRNASFNHYLFETLSCLITFVTKMDPSAVNTFEQQLMGPFQQMLNMETCQEFSPYIFQLLAQMLESRPDISEPYQQIFPVLLVPQLWENQGNVPAVVRLLQAYLKKGGVQVVTGTRLPGLLGIFQKLLANSKLDQHAMDLINFIVEYLPIATFSQFLPEVFRLIFTRLRSKMTPKLAKYVILFISHMVSKHGIDVVLAAMDQVQPGIFSMLLEKIMLPHVNTMTSSVDKKTSIIGFTLLVTKPSKFLETPAYQALWGPTVGGIVRIIENKDGAVADQEEEDVLDASERAFNTSYAKLAYAPAPDNDFNPSIPDAKSVFITSLKQLMAPNPAQFTPALQKLDAPIQQTLQQYLA